jgi:DNA-binding winged helix-turn-helix (wHTH) protein/TolB-like protein/tetratricopeptide (TPR) repeat protein
MDAHQIRGYQFAGFSFEPAKRRLSGPDGVAIPLSGRAWDVLAYLVANRDRVVGKDELIKTVWPHNIVEDNNLNQAISTVRRALGDSRDTPRFIVTVAGRGYQFIGDVVPLAIAGADPGDPATHQPSVAFQQESSDAAVVSVEFPISSPAQASEQATRISRRAALYGLAAAAAVAAGTFLWWNGSRQRSRIPKSIAVLPFKPLLPEARNPPMELGVTELLVNRLSRLPGVVVAPLSSVMRFAAADVDPLEAGRKLRVEAVVDGYLYVVDDRVRLTARLLAVDDGASLWANNFTEPVGELLTIQDTLAIQLVNALTIELSNDTRSGVLAQETSDVEAWQLYVNGRYQIERRDASSLRRAIEFFDAALRRDPRFALASAGLSDAHALTAVFGIEPPAKAFAQARQAALRALELDPRLPAAHVALGHVLTQYDRDLEAGRKAYLQALNLKPEFGWAMAFMALNLTQASEVANATERIRKAQALEPANFAFLALSGWVRYFARGYDESERELSRLVEAAPQAALPRQFLAHTLLIRGKGAEVQRLLEGRNDPAPCAFSNLARAYAQTGNISAARAEIDRLEALGSQGYGVGFELALIHLELGERDLALASLERGLGDHSQMQGYLNVEPALDSIRAEPRFQAVSRRLTLSQ